MFALIKNEYIKIFKKGKSWAVFALFLAFLGLMVFAQYSEDKNMRLWNSLEYKVKMIDDQVKYMEEDIQHNKKLLEEGKKDPYITENITMREAELKNQKEQKEKYEKLISEGKTELDWKEKYTEEREYLKSDLEAIEKGEEIFGENTEQQKQYSEERIKEINYYLDNDIKPVEDWEFNPYNIIKNMFSGLGSVLLILVIAVFIGDSVSGECTPPTLKFLVIQPVSRGKILFAKFFTSVTSIIGGILSCQLITFLAVGVMKGFESGKSMLKMGVKYEINPMKLENGRPILEKIAGSGEMVTLNEFTIKVVLIQILFMIAVSSVIFLISSVIKNNLVSMALSVILLVIMSVIVEFATISEKIGHLLFTTYGNISLLLTGELARYSNNPALTLENGILVMGITILVSYVISHIIFNKKDILI